MTYTQGPWTIDYAMNDYEGHYLNGAGRLVAITNTVENEVTDEDRANARLIASAPDLLECLQKWMSFQINSGLEGCDEIVEQTEKAIARATGAEVEA